MIMNSCSRVKNASVNIFLNHPPFLAFFQSSIFLHSSLSMQRYNMLFHAKCGGALGVLQTAACNAPVAGLFVRLYLLEPLFKVVVQITADCSEDFMMTFLDHKIMTPVTQSTACQCWREAVFSLRNNSGNTYHRSKMLIKGFTAYVHCPVLLFSMSIGGDMFTHCHKFK